ncbi:hypothetical protein FKP32DRAFT_1590296 [Trametes sanguinea]|nr:hypothetical protein FKP32DRAFT_1590296 [Trametes sanguinea]
MDPSEPALQLTTSEPTVAARRAFWNARQDVSKLPVETLVEIFLYLSAPPGEADEATVSRNGAEWFRLMLVCRRWRAVVKSNPCFWQDIVVTDSIDWWNLAIARTSTATLRLSFEAGSSPSESLIPEIMACRGRIERLVICGTQSECQWVLPLVDGSLPSLTSLDIDWDVDNDSEGPYVLNPENYPRLRRLRLADTCLPWTLSLLGRLRSLQLHYCTTAPATLPFKEFLEVLQGAPQLEELELSDIMSRVCPYSSLGTTGAQAPGLIHFPRLHDLRVQDAIPWLAEFLARVELPSRGRIAVTAIVTPEEVENELNLSAYASIFPADPERTPFFRTATRAKLVVENRGAPCWAISCGAAGPSGFTFKYGFLGDEQHRSWWNSEAQGLSYFTQLLRGAPLTELDLALRIRYLDSPVLRTLIETFPGIQKLRIGQKTESPEMTFPSEIFEAFSGRSYPRDDDSETYRHGLSWPHLKTIHIDGIRWKDGEFVPTLLQCLYERAKRGAPRLEAFLLTVFRTPLEDWTVVDTLIRTTVELFADTYTCDVRPLALPPSP